MTNVVQFPRRKPVCAVSEAKASLVLAVIRSEKLASELEELERDLDELLKRNPRVTL